MTVSRFNVLTASLVAPRSSVTRVPAITFRSNFVQFPVSILWLGRVTAANRSHSPEQRDVVRPAGILLEQNAPMWLACGEGDGVPAGGAVGDDVGDLVGLG